MKKTILALGLMVAFVSCGTVVNEEVVVTTDSTMVEADTTATDTLVTTIDSVEVVN